MNLWSNRILLTNHSMVASRKHEFSWGIILYWTIQNSWILVSCDMFQQNRIISLTAYFLLLPHDHKAVWVGGKETVQPDYYFCFIAWREMYNVIMWMFRSKFSALLTVSDKWVKLNTFVSCLWKIYPKPGLEFSRIKQTFPSAHCSSLFNLERLS